MAITVTSTMVGASPDYERYLYGSPKKTDRERDSTLLDFALVPVDAGFVKLVRGAYVTISTASDSKWYTGYIVNEPELEYLGVKAGQPHWGYRYQLTSDEYLLSLKPVGLLPTFMNVYMGDILKTLVDKLVPGVFNVTGIDNGPLVAQFSVEPNSKFFDVQRSLCESASYVFWANDKKLYFKPQDSVTLGGLVLDKNNKHFTPSNFKIRPSASSASPANDVTVFGDLEPQTYATEYFVGTGLDAVFPLMHGVFGAESSVLLDEPFSEDGIDLTKWTVNDTVNDYIQVGNGYCNILGGDGDYSHVNISSKSLIPLEGNLRLVHGDWRLTSGAGAIAGLWTQAPSSFLTGCLYGLYFDGTTLSPVINGVVDGSQFVTVNTSNRFVIRTLANFRRTNRLTQTYNYLDASGDVQGYTGTPASDVVEWETLISEVDVNTGSLVQQFHFTNSSSLSDTQCYARYIPVASGNLNAAFTGVTLSVPMMAKLSLATKVPVVNADFNDWDSNTTPTGWVSENCLKETVVVDSQLASKMTAHTAQDTYMLQSANTIFSVDTEYRVHIRARRTPGLAAGNLQVTLTGTGVYETFTVSYADMSSSAYSTFFGTLTTGIATLPDDLTLVVEVVGGTDGESVYVDSLSIVTPFVAKPIGPNEIDGMDGLSPIATIISPGTSSESNSTFSGVAQYNPGQSQLVFFKDSVQLDSSLPSENQVIMLRYRTAGPAMGRVINSSHISSEAAIWGDDGVRSVAKSEDVVPRPRTSKECELAAAAIASEASKPRYEGTYTVWSDYQTTPPRAGGLVSFLNFGSTINASYEEITEVVTTIESKSPVERFKYEITFGKSDTARKLFEQLYEPLDSFKQSAATVEYYGPVPVTEINDVGRYASDPVNVHLEAWSTATITINFGESLGGGDTAYEVRYTDHGWGDLTNLNLVVRTTAERVTLRRSLSGRTYFIRKVNTQGRTSRYSAAIRVSFPISAADLPVSVSPIGDISGLAAAAYNGNDGQLAIYVTGTAPADENFKGALMYLWTPKDSDPDPENPSVTGVLYPQGFHYYSGTGPFEAVLRVPYPWLNKVKWVVYAVSANFDYSNELTPIEQWSPVLPANVTPYAILNLDLTDLDDEPGALPSRQRWHPNAVAPATGDPVVPASEKTFGLREGYAQLADGSMQAGFVVDGSIPVNTFLTTVGKPLITDLDAYASGGNLGGGRYWLALICFNASGEFSPLSKVHSIVVPSGTTGRITIAVTWPTGVWSGGFLYISQADRPDTVTSQQVLTSPLPIFIDVTYALSLSNYTTPDENYKCVRAKVKRVDLAGVANSPITSVSANTVVCAGLIGSGLDFTGHIASVVSDVDEGAVNLWNYTVTAYNDTTGTFTVSPDPMVHPSGAPDVGAVFNVHTKATGPFTSTILRDTLLTMVVDEHKGKIARVLYGTGITQNRRILSNTATTLTVDPPLDIVPDATTVFIVERPEWEHIIDSAEVASRSVDLSQQMFVPVTNWLGEFVLVCCVMVTQDGLETWEENSPTRLGYVTGREGSAGPPKFKVHMGLEGDASLTTGLAWPYNVVIGATEKVVFDVFTIKVLSAPSGADLIVDVVVVDNLLSETSIFPDGNANKLVVAAGQKFDEVTVFRTPFPDILEGYELKPVVLQTGVAPNPGSGILIQGDGHKETI